MANRFEWLDRPGAEPAPEQYIAIINALGDWIEAHLTFSDKLKAKVGTATWAEISKVLDDARKVEEAAKADARRRAIEAGYLWRLDLDP